jgi:hypothetical protein
LSGKYLGLQPLTTQLDLCSNLPLGTEGNPPEFLKIGHGVFRECSVNISTLLLESTAPRQLFYDLYLKDSDGSLVSTASKLLNFRLNNEKVNVDTSDDAQLNDEQFTRRFVLFDRLSGLDTASSPKPKVLRYPKLMKLTIKVSLLAKIPHVHAYLLVPFNSTTRPHLLTTAHCPPPPNRYRRTPARSALTM